MRDIVYSPRSELARPRLFLAAALADLRRSGPVGWCLFTSNLRARYRRAWLSYLWLLLPALGTALLCGFIQSRRIVTIAPTELPYPIFVLAGMILWQTFVEALNGPLQQLSANRQLATRSRVPHEAIILAGLIETLLNAGVRLTVLALVFGLYGRPFVPEMLLIPFGVAALALLGLSFGLLLAPVGTLYDDIVRAISLGATFLMFLTPVLYPLPRGGILRLNPVTPLLDTTRGWLTGHGVGNSFIIVVVAAAALTVIAWLLYRLARPHVFARLA
jgi:lipopolysaccharide transport system permease protein